MGQATAIIDWRLDNDSTIREAFYETDSDLTNRFFTRLLFDPVGFRNLVVTEHGLLNAAHPDRYKRFIVADDTSHTALQTPLFNIQEANLELVEMPLVIGVFRQHIAPHRAPPTGRGS